MSESGRSGKFEQRGNHDSNRKNNSGTCRNAGDFPFKERKKSHSTGWKEGLAGRKKKRSFLEGTIRIYETKRRTEEEE